MPRVVSFHELGDAGVLRIDDVPMPEAGEKEVVLQVRAFGLNRAEVMFGRNCWSPCSEEDRGSSDKPAPIDSPVKHLAPKASCESSPASLQEAQKARWPFGEALR